jgi:hypothetical protein
MPVRERRAAGRHASRSRVSWLVTPALAALLGACGAGTRSPASSPDAGGGTARTAPGATGDPGAAIPRSDPWLPASDPAGAGAPAAPSVAGLAAETAAATSAAASDDAGAAGVAEMQTVPPCSDPVPVFEGGREIRRVCPADAPGEGLTVVDLSDDWVPFVLRDTGDPAGPPQPYRATYLALANEEYPAGPEGDRPRHDRFLELYGIAPTFRVLAARILDEDRHLCSARVDQTALQALASSPWPSTSPLTPALRKALGALQQLLACGRLLPSSTQRLPRWRLQEALEAYQREQTIVARGQLNRETRRALAEDGRELDFRALLRALRARVADATGLIEDGTALAARGTVLSRHIDGDAFYASDGREPEEGGAPDLISPATEAAATALGWSEPAAAAEFFRARGAAATRRLKVALQLPPLPSYHSSEMDLFVEIDRGDVWYELPTRRHAIRLRPTLTLYARRADGDEVALVRWPTTIGGWKKEVAPGRGLGLRYKNSEVGSRVWRDLVVAPAWLPPPQTPARALVRRSYGPKRWLPDMDLVGPGYASAYGLVMLVHHRPVTGRHGTIWYDNGIRTHGSVSYQSILRGESHGCHRLFNQAALQLASFLLQHRRSVCHGVLARPFTHEFTWRGVTWRFPIASRGYRFELTPPVEVEVLPGTLHGRVRKVPHRFVRLQRPRPPAAAPERPPPEPPPPLARAPSESPPAAAPAP